MKKPFIPSIASLETSSHPAFADELDSIFIRFGNQIVIGLVLILLMAATRGHHFATLEHLPGASWAVFFLAGVYLRSAWVLPALLGFAWSLDFAAFTWGGVSGFCLTPAYVFLLPAYSSLWFAGRWYAERPGQTGIHALNWYSFMSFSFALVVGAATCELFSSGGFYFFSGRFVEPTFIEFGARLLKYFPSYLQSLIFYVGISVVLHWVISRLRRSATPEDASAV